MLRYVSIVLIAMLQVQEWVERWVQQWDWVPVLVCPNNQHLLHILSSNILVVVAWTHNRENWRTVQQTQISNSLEFYHQPLPWFHNKTFTQWMNVTEAPQKIQLHPTVVEQILPMKLRKKGLKEQALEIHLLMINPRKDNNGWQFYQLLVPYFEVVMAVFIISILQRFFKPKPKYPFYIVKMTAFYYLNIFL